jgi:hypothetical protein
MCVYVGIDVHRKRSQVAVVVELWLAGREALPRRSLQSLELGVIMRRADVLDTPRPAPR